MQGKTVLSVRELYLDQGKTPILEGLSMEAKSGSFTAVLGQNGVGKTTLLRCIDGLLKPKSGEICVLDAPLAAYSPAALAKQVAYVPQRVRFGEGTVFDAVLLGRLPHLSRRVSEEDLQAVERVLERLGLSRLAMRSVNTLSGGEGQLVALARSLVQKPSVLLLDEPTANLDMGNAIGVMSLLRTLAAQEGIAVVACIHDLSLALRYADVFCFLHKGRTLSLGGRETLTSSLIEEVYGVKVKLIREEGHSAVIPLEAEEAWNMRGDSDENN